MVSLGSFSQFRQIVNLFANKSGNQCNRCPPFFVFFFSLRFFSLKVSLYYLSLTLCVDISQGQTEFVKEYIKMAVFFLKKKRLNFLEDFPLCNTPKKSARILHLHVHTAHHHVY